ncbi:hypothetical protein [Clostridium vincentii]|uniref:hypothetical protein n=1 Tax=Clostridium vincentii TaxID=52704 RepID=UPI001A9A669A|nr:hypothetical protein [Clostridium vincentii]
MGNREEKLRDKQGQIERIADNNIAWNYVNDRLRCKFEYLEKMEQELVEIYGDN